jgi:flagellin
MTVINSNIPSTIANNALRLNQRAMSQAMERLSTGKRINSGADDPAGLGVAARLEAASRADRMGIRNANDAIVMLQTFSSAGQTIRDVVLRMKELAMQAATDTLTWNDREALDQEYNQLGNEWTRIATTTSWNGQTLMTGGDGASAAAAFTVKISGGAGAGSNIVMRLNNWNPTSNTTGAGQNFSVTGARVAGTLDNNAGNAGATMQDFAFNRGTNNLAPTPIANSMSFDHIQSRVAATNAVTKLETALTGISRELANHGAIINRMTISTDNLTSIATSLEKSRSIIEDADYATETTELSRTQIISQAATAMLAQANAAPQTVLALLQ